MAVLLQVVSSIIICYLCMSLGLMFTWPSSTLQLFESQNTTLTRPMGSTELALFSSLSSIGAMIVTPVAAYLMDTIGRKKTALVLSMASTLSWTLIAASNQVELVLTAIFISGMGGAVFLVVPVYIGEICQESIRGAMMSCSIVFAAGGMLVSYILGGYCEYHVMIYASLSVCVSGAALLLLLKESPTFLMQKGLEAEAIRSIAFYRSADPDSKEVLNELNAIRRAINPDLEESVSEEEQKLNKDEKVEKKPQAPKEKLSIIQFLRKSPSTRRALFVAVTVGVSAVFQGLIVVQVYAMPLFSEAIPTMSATVCSIIFALVTILSALGSAYLSETAGRKALMVYSCMASGLCCLTLGSQIQLHWAPHALTAVLIYAFCVFYTLGAGTIPFVIAAEVFLPEIKSFVSMLCIELNWLCSFIILFIFNPLVEAIGLGPVFYLFATICFCSSLFCIFFLPETKGLTVDAIQLLFLDSKKKNSRV
ncbi:hypothetical protein JYU34_015394 [Plutella xylostella]|uniref:Major facilitator superfamily (MFS) profile domain-containing protein n=1 Tax=Plutella xylostella TaxID=51655 RepID=A0ABQ7Q759_PLUXY|nr:facilitated trehalose transporter Tret1 [Plutella xylostella]KAG7301021.1 hypothetical protein JYU34_015394 [Plutella xylostella]